MPNEDLHEIKTEPDILHKYIDFDDHMTRACRSGKLKFNGRYKQLKKTLYAKKWVISVRDPIRQAHHVLVKIRGRSFNHKLFYHYFNDREVSCHENQE